MERSEIESYKINLNSVRSLMQSYCRLSEDQVNNLEGICFKYATTTVYPNSEIVLRLMNDSYTKLAKGTPYDDVMNSIKSRI